MGAITKTLYETDFAAWADEMAAALRAGRVQELDLENLAEEIEGLARTERKAVRSQLQRMMVHLLKRDSASWQVSIGNARDEIVDEIEDSPTLRPHLYQNLERVYGLAVNQALRETKLKGKSTDIPAKCPWTLEQLLEGDLDSLD